MSLRLAIVGTGLIGASIGLAARRAGVAVTGWDVDPDELRRTARRIVVAKRLFNLREGWTRADDRLPERFLTEPLELDSGREATLTQERLTTMIDAYYVGRGLDRDGIPKPETRVELGLDLFMQAP